jgi:ankyrin repeat protein
LFLVTYGTKFAPKNSIANTTQLDETAVESYLAFSSFLLHSSAYTKRTKCHLIQSKKFRPQPSRNTFFLNQRNLMKKPNKYFCLLLLLIGFVQIDGKEENLAAKDYSKMSIAELDTAFVLAVQEHSSEKMQELIQAGANVNTQIPYTWTSGDCDWKIESTALMYAVRHNCPNMVKVLLKVEKKLNEALDVAIKEGYSDVVEELIKGGADINYVNENKDTHLIIAIQHARATAEFSPQAQEQATSRWYQRRKIIQTLLKAGANVNHVNKYGRTALMEAIVKHDLNTVQNLLQAPEIHTGSFFDFATKAINYADKDGNTALILAIQNVRCSYINNQEYKICTNSQNIIKELLETPGIDPHHVNKNDETAIILLEKLNKKMNAYPY